MTPQITKLNDGYTLQLTLHSTLPIETVWEWFATSEGFAKWFPELSVNNDASCLNFTYNNELLETMPILSYTPLKEISYQWDKGTVKMTFATTTEKTTVHFTEFLPFSFERIANDFAGWTIHFTRLNALLNQQVAPEISAIQPKIEQQITQIIHQL